MSLPAPDDLRQAPLWDNYVVAQTVQASLGLVPLNAVAVGVKIVGATVTVLFQLTELAEADREDLDDIVDELQRLVGDEVQVRGEPEIVEMRSISPHDDVRWVYLARVDDLREG